MKNYTLSIPESILLDSTLTPTDKLVYGLLNSNKELSASTIAKIIGRTKRTVWRIKLKFNSVTVSDTDVTPDSDTDVTPSDTDVTPAYSKTFYHIYSRIMEIQSMNEYKTKKDFFKQFFASKPNLTKTEIDLLKKQIILKIQKLKNIN